MNRRRWAGILVVFILALVIMTGCGGGGSSSGDKGGTAGTGKIVSGIVSKGPLMGAMVTIHALDAAGAQGAVLASASTGTNGAYTADIGSYAGNILVVVSGGTYIDETTLSPVANTIQLRAAVVNVTGNVSVAVTPLTELAVQRAGTLTTENIEAANTLVSNMIGGLDIITTQPANVLVSSSSTTAEKDYGLACAAFSQMVSSGTATSVSSAISEIATDLADNTLEATGADISAAIDTFIASGNNQTGLTTSTSSVPQSVTIATTTPISLIPATYSMSGTVTLSGPGLQGVTLTLDGSSSAMATTDASGNFSFSGLANGSYTVTPVKAGYSFNPTSSAQIVNGANISGVAFTATVALALAAPTGITAAAGDGKVTINWNASAGATFYNIYWSTSSGVTTASGTKISNIATPPYQHTNRTNGTTYYYVITAVSGSEESAPSVEASAKPLAASGAKLIKVTMYNTAGMMTGYTTYEYDAAGNILKVSSYGPTGVLSISTTFEYDAAGNKIKISNFIVTGALAGYVTLEYDAAGNEVKVSSYGPTGLLLTYTTTEYDAAGKVSKSSTYGSTGVISEYTTYEYNAAGDETGKSNYDFADQLTGYTTTEYNAAGEEIRVTDYGPTGLLSESKTAEYDASGRVVKRSTYNLTGLTEYTTYVFDAEGNMAKESKYDFADLLTEYTTIEYNAAHMPVKMSLYGPTGLLTISMTYEYGN